MSFFWDYDTDDGQTYENELELACSNGGWGPHCEEILTVLMEEEQNGMYGTGWF